jgi:hypothetical protein
MDKAWAVRAGVTPGLPVPRWHGRGRGGGRSAEESLKAWLDEHPELRNASKAS